MGELLSPSGRPCGQRDNLSSDRRGDRWNNWWSDRLNDRMRAPWNDPLRDQIHFPHFHLGPPKAQLEGEIITITSALGGKIKTKQKKQ